MTAFVVSRSGLEANMHGFGTTSEGHGHFWLMAGNRLVDIGPHYLPREASQPSEPMPLVAWDLTEPLPPFLRYRSREDLGLRTVLVSDPEIEARMASFVALCQRKSRAQIGQPKLPHWLLKDTASFLERGESSVRSNGVHMWTPLGVGPSGRTGLVFVIDRAVGLSQDEGHGQAPNP